MSTQHEIAEAFSGHRFSEAYDHLAPDIRWVLVGAQTISGRDEVIGVCQQTLSELVDTTTEFSRFLTIAGNDAVAVDSVAAYTGTDGTTIVVASCDIYEFTDDLVTTITSYTAEIEAAGEPAPA
jgi:limonene-1,2-epoxide hydrolase